MIITPPSLGCAFKVETVEMELMVKSATQWFLTDNKLTHPVSQPRYAHCNATSDPSHLASKGTGTPQIHMLTSIMLRVRRGHPRRLGSASMVNSDWFVAIKSWGSSSARCATATNHNSSTFREWVQILYREDTYHRYSQDWQKEMNTNHRHDCHEVPELQPQECRSPFLHVALRSLIHRHRDCYRCQAPSLNHRCQPRCPMARFYQNRGQWHLVQNQQPQSDVHS